MRYRGFSSKLTSRSEPSERASVHSDKERSEYKVVEAWRVLNFPRRCAVGYQLEGRNVDKNPISHSISRATRKRDSTLPLTSVFDSRCWTTKLQKHLRRLYPWWLPPPRPERFFPILRGLAGLFRRRNGSSNTESHGLRHRAMGYFISPETNSRRRSSTRGGNHKQWWRKIEKRIEGTIVVHGSVFLKAIYRTFFCYAKLEFPRSG